MVKAQFLMRPHYRFNAAGLIRPRSSLSKEEKLKEEADQIPSGGAARATLADFLGALELVALRTVERLLGFFHFLTDAAALAELPDVVVVGPGCLATGRLTGKLVGRGRIVAEDFALSRQPMFLGIAVASVTFP